MKFHWVESYETAVFVGQNNPKGCAAATDNSP